MNDSSGCLGIPSLLADTIRFLQEEYAGDESLYLSAPLHKKTAVIRKQEVYLTPPPPPAPKKQEPAPIPAAPEKRQDKPPIVSEKDLLATLSKAAPHIRLRNQSLSDEEGQRTALQWKEKDPLAPIVILSFGQTEQESLFLENVARAIEQRYLPAKVITITRYMHSDDIRWILAPQEVQKNPLFRSIPATGDHFLGKVPLTLLAPLGHYLKNPALKKTLWEQISSRLSS